MEELDEFIATVAAAKPLPAGGSAAALAGALAAALGEMMAGLTEGRENFAAVQPQVRYIRGEMARLRKELRSLVQEDILAYRSLLNAMQMPREPEEQKTLRAQAIERSARDATITPLRTARAAVKVLEHLQILIEIGNPHARSDVAVGAQLAYASLKAGQYNTLANIRILKDMSFAESCRAEISDLLVKGQRVLESIDRQITG